MSLATKTKTRVGAVRSYPTDLAAVSLAAVVSYLLITTNPSGNALRLLAALPLVAFLPGYALVAVLFPARARSSRETVAESEEGYPRGIDAIERVALSMALSVLVAPIVTMVIAPSQWALSPEATAGALAGGTIAFAQAGVVRRIRVPEPDRFDVSAASFLRRIRPTSDGGVVGTASSLLLAAGVVATAIALSVSLVSPPAAGGYSELGLYTDEENGELVADDYPDELAPGESEQLVLSIENHEGEETTYTVVVQQQRLEGDAVTERTELDRFSETVPDGETATIDHELAPTASDGQVRVTYLLFEGDVPDEPTRANADEDVYVWVTVSDDASGG